MGGLPIFAKRRGIGRLGNCAAHVEMPIGPVIPIEASTATASGFLAAD